MLNQHIASHKNGNTVMLHLGNVVRRLTSKISMLKKLWEMQTVLRSTSTSRKKTLF